MNFARLGDLDLNSGTSKKKDYRISLRYYHPQYSPAHIYNDLGLIALEEPVTFTPFIKPACLYTRESAGRFIDLIATGWGLTEFGGERSPVLMKVFLDTFTDEECNSTYKASRRLPLGIQSDKQFCAGGRGLEKDTCNVSSCYFWVRVPNAKAQSRKRAR